MGLREVFAQAVADLYSDPDMGSVAVFTPLAGDPVPECHVVVRFNQQLATSGLDSQVFTLGTTLRYLQAEIGRQVKVGEIFTDSSGIYTVEKLLSNDGISGMVVVKC